ncbi:trigger factor [Halobacteriovorax sp. HLS]|uniref:trigger factor n=1 Tax=Halobacteriovorax sp. HLS TaxID=2234000 RepID=UPI000FDB97C6|nr:trigger factor [Halobacteriovorax sp. HLS]
MSYTVETINGCTKKLAFNFETLDLTSEIKTAIVQKQKTVSLKGFRKGKAPLTMVQQVYGQQIESEALNQFVQNRFFEAVQKEDLRVVGYPSFENMNYDEGKSVKFDALVEIFPTVEVKGLDKVEISQETVSVSDEDVDNIQKNYLNSKAEMKEIEGDKKLAKGQFAVLNFQGEKADGERPENMKGEEFLLEIGSGQFIPGFEDGMIGMKKGEKKNIELSFPADYHVEDLKEAKVVFETELLEIKEKVYPEFSDDLAKEFGFESVEDFKTKTKENLFKQKEREVLEKTHQEILEKLIELNTFDVPKALVSQQENHLKEDLAKNLKGQGFNEDMLGEYFAKWAGDLEEKATFQVRSGLLLDNLAKKYEVEASESDFDAKIEEMAAGSGMQADQIKSYYSTDERLKGNLMYAIREEKTFAKIKEEIKLK